MDATKATLPSAGINTGISGNTDKNIAQTQDRFLTLLITQMKSQDPMNPMDNAAVTSQIAQISAVSGIEKLNTTMADLASSMSSSQFTQGAALMGKMVAAPGNLVEIKSGQALGGVKLAGPADSVSVTFADVNTGAPLRVVDMGGQDAGVSMAKLGADLPDGPYKISIKASLAGKTVSAEPVTTGQVTTVQPGSPGGSNKLGLSNGAYIDQSSILQFI